MSLALPPLLDDRSAPTLREGMGLLMMRAARSDFAVQHVRLAALDLGAEELARGRCRLLLGRFDADVLADFSADDAARRRLAVLAAFLDSGRLAVRAAGLLRWYPDFSIHHRIEGAVPPAVALLGAHQLTRSPAATGPALGGVLTGPAVVSIARHFRVLWRRGHDVRDVIRGELRVRGV